jgi:hypothetical protein
VGDDANVDNDNEADADKSGDEVQADHVMVPQIAVTPSALQWLSSNRKCGFLAIADHIKVALKSHRKHLRLTGEHFMRSRFAAAALTCLLSTPLYAQSNTAVGTGISAARSTSVSGAVAISGQGGGGGQGGQGGSSNSSLTVNNPANTTSTVDQRISGTTTSNVNQNTNLSGTTTSNVNTSGTTSSNVNQNVSGATTTRVVSSGTTTVRTAPSMVAPGLAAAGLETCLGSASGTVSAIGFGIGGGSTYADEGCQARLDSRTLYAYGLKAAAVARLCQRADIWRSMPDMCAQYWPPGQPYPAGIYVAARPAGYVMSAEAGTIRVVDGRDGVEKDCVSYSHTKQRCYRWSGEASRQSRVAALPPPRIIIKPKPRPTKPEPKVEPASVVVP